MLFYCKYFAVLWLGPIYDPSLSFLSRSLQINIFSRMWWEKCSAGRWTRVSSQIRFVRSRPIVLALCVKPWPNGLASRRKFWICVQLAFRLATHLASTCVDFGGAQIWTQVDALLPFGHPAQVDTSWSQEICCYKNALTNDIREIYGFLRLASRLANPFGHPSQVHTQVLLLQSCVDLRVRLASGLNHAQKKRQKFLFQINLLLFLIIDKHKVGLVK